MSTSPCATAAAAKQVGSPRRILIVEDDADGLEALSELLEGRGYEVSVSCTAAAAMTLLGIARPDVAVVDLGLPDATDGIDLIRRLKAADATTTVVAFSGLLAAERAARAAGADWFVVKPDSDTLERVLVCLRDQKR